MELTVGTVHQGVGEGQVAGDANNQASDAQHGHQNSDELGAQVGSGAQPGGGCVLGLFLPGSRRRSARRL